jgi:hypothetical protein
MICSASVPIHLEVMKEHINAEKCWAKLLRASMWQCVMFPGRKKLAGRCTVRMNE